MRKLQGLSSVLEQQAMQQTFGAGSFYRSKAKKRIYLGPLERLDYRRKQQFTSLIKFANWDDPGTVHLKPTVSIIPKSVTVVKRERKSRVAKKLRLRNKPRPRKNMQKESSSNQQAKKSLKSPSKVGRSPKIAKKGVRLYLQNLRNKHSNKGRKKVTWPGKYKPEKSASRTLGFEGAGARENATTKISQGTLKRNSEEAQQSQSKRAKVAGELPHQEVLFGDSPPASESLPEEASPKERASPRRRRMKTDAESLATSGDGKRETVSGKTEEEFEEWLWSSSAEANKDDSPKKTEATTPVKMLTSTPKVYPTITPPVTPSTSASSPGSSATPRYFPLLAKTAGRTTLSPISKGTRSRKPGVRTRSQGSRPSPKSPAAWNRIRDKDGMEQMVLDLGQKYFGAVNCDTCGMVYTATHPEDEANHARFHRKYLSCTRFNGWKTEEVLEEFPDGRIIVISPDAPKYAHKKVEEIRALVDRELGFVEGNSLSGKELCKTYLFITNDKKIGGCLIAEGISKGYRVIPDKEPQSVAEELQKAWCCESEPSSAVCGISRIWVAGLMRRKGIATRLMEALRHHFTYGSILAMDDLAFSDPTPNGKLFATSYTGSDSFLVYKYT